MEMEDTQIFQRQISIENKMITDILEASLGLQRRLVVRLKPKWNLIAFARSYVSMDWKKTQYFQFSTLFFISYSW